MHLRTLYMRTNGIREPSKLTHVSRSTNVKTLGEIVDARVTGCEIRRKTAVECRIEHFCHLGEEQFAYVLQGETSALHGHRNSHSLEIPAVMHRTGLTIYERVVRS